MGKPEGSNSVEDLGVDGRIILIFITFIVSPCIFVHLVLHQLMHSYIYY